LAQSNLLTQGHSEEQYSIDIAKVVATTMHHWNMVMHNQEHKHHAFIKMYSLKHGIKTFGKEAEDTASTEMQQLHDRSIFWPMHVESLTAQKRHRVMESLIFITEKRDGQIKVCTCANGSMQ
jgi:hypothetical protein